SALARAPARPTFRRSAAGRLVGRTTRCPPAATPGSAAPRRRQALSSAPRGRCPKPRPCVLGSSVELAGKLLARRQDGEALGDVDARLVQLQQFDLLPALPRAEDEAERRLLPALAIAPVEPAQVELHLALVLRLERADLEVHGHKAAELAVVEEQVE